MSTLTTTHATHRLRRFAVVGVIAATLAAGSTAIVVSVGGSPTTTRTHSSAVGALSNYAPDYVGRRPPQSGRAIPSSEQPTPQTPGQR